MDTLCGVGLPELIILALLVFVLLGPERTRELALDAGRWLGRLMKSPWWGEVNRIAKALRDLPTTLVRMAELEETQAELKKTLADIDHAVRPDDPLRETGLFPRTGTPQAEEAEPIAPPPNSEPLPSEDSEQSQ